MASREGRKGRWAVWALVAVVIAAHGAALAWWIHLDERKGAQVCCALVIPIFDVLRPLAAEARDPTMIHWGLDKGLLSWGVLGFRAMVGGAPDFTLYFNLLCIALTQLILFDLGRRLSGPWVGLLAAALLPLYPVIAFISRRWDINALQLPLLVGAAWLLVRSASFSRLWPTLGLAALTALGTCLSPRRSENLLFFFTVASMSGGAVLRALLTGRGPLGERVSGRRALGVGVATLGVVLAVLMIFVPGFAPGGWVYYPAELDNPVYTLGVPWYHPRRLFAYLHHLYLRGMTPPLALLFFVCLAAWLRRGRGRAELLGWLMGPAVLLSIIPKKNFYYLSVVYPTLPLITALGLGALRWRRGRIPLAAAALVFGLVMLTARAFPQLVEGTRLAEVAWHSGDERMNKMMQTIDFELNLAPLAVDPQQPQIDFLLKEIKGDSCACPFVVGWASDEAYDGV